MPRKERTVPRPGAILASARNYTTNRSQAKVEKQRSRTAEEWMHAAWDFFDMIPEYHQGCLALGALLSRAKLVVEERGADGVWRPTENPAVLQVHNELYGGEEGQAEMLRQFGIHFSVTGEGWLIAESGATSPDQWMVASPTVVRKGAGSTWRVNDEDLAGNPLVIRIWRAHSLDRKKADSPTRAILPVLSELLQLTKRVAAQIDSRLLGGGLLLLPSETSFGVAPQKALNVGDPVMGGTDSLAPGDAQGLADMLVEQANRAIANPEDPSAVFPIIGETPGEYIDKARHLTFWSELDKTAPKLRSESINRIANGMDIPPEVLLGAQGSNHWNAWLSDEVSVKIHAEPNLKTIVTSLSSGYLRPALTGIVDDPTRFRYSSDTSQMRLRPNRSKEALELNDRLILSDEATARENGFEPSDLMTKDEQATKILGLAARGSTTPEIVAAAMKKVGVDLGINITDQRDPAQARPNRSLNEHPVREIPTAPTGNAPDSGTGRGDTGNKQLPASLDGATLGLLYASEQLVDRALQRAGNRLKTQMPLQERKQVTVPANRLYRTAQIAPEDVADLLSDAWSGCHDYDYGVRGTDLERVLSLYTRSLLLSGQEPTRRGLMVALSLLPEPLKP